MTNESTLAVEPTLEATGRFQRSLFWLISKHYDGQTEVLSIAGGGTLPVFSFKEEAEMFLLLGAFGADWSIRRTTTGELVSVLHGSCASVAKVALDPPPELCGRALVELVSLTKGDFLRTILVGSTPSRNSEGR